MLAEIAALTGRKAPTLAPAARAALSPRLSPPRAVARITGKEPLLTRDALKMAAHHMFFSSAKAERELGYHGAAATARRWPTPSPGSAPPGTSR